MVTCKYGYRLNFLSFFLFVIRSSIACRANWDRIAGVRLERLWTRLRAPHKYFPDLASSLSSQKLQRKMHHRCYFSLCHDMDQKKRERNLLVAVPDDFQNEMMVLAFAATLMATIPILLGNEFDVNVGLKKKKVNLKKWNDTLPANRKKPSSFCRENAEVCLRITGWWNQLMVME